MTRRSRREIERLLDGLEVDDTGEWSDVGEAVTASFVTYADDAVGGDDLPDGCTVTETVSIGDAEFQVVSGVDESGDGGASQ